MTVPSKTVPNKLEATISDGELWQSEGSFPVPWWSFTKTCLAAVTLKLVLQGYLALDEPIENKPYTLGQLLQHRTGLPNYSSMKIYRDAVINGEVPWSGETMLQRSNPDQLLFQPGEDFAYSNIGYYLVRRILEQLTGDTLGDIFSQFIFKPLGISGVHVAQTPADLDDVKWKSHNNYHPSWVYHGLLVGPPVEAAKVLHHLMVGDLLPIRLVKEMKKAYPLNIATDGRPWRQPGYGLGLMIDIAGEKGAVYGHTGQGPGSVIAVYHFDDVSPKRTVAVSQPVSTQGIVEASAVELA
ncbi:MAG: serine hydrolase domain-containing protein [Cyanobacteria bacterium P01_D01_bin.105]